MESILQSYARLCRALILLLCLSLLIYFLATTIFKQINAVSDVAVEVNEKGGIILKVSKKGSSDVVEKYAQFMLPSNKVWVNTGIDVAEDEECEFKITGNVHLAISKLVTEVKDDRIPVIRWTGPEGSKWENIGDKDECAKAKTKLLVKPGDVIGNIVGYFYKDGDISDRDFLNYFLTNRKTATDKVFEIGEKLTKANTSNAKARLFICVNDILLDRTNTEQEELSRTAFEGRKSKENTAQWNSLLQEEEYYRLWFDDNVGGFLVNVTIRKKKNG